MPLSHRRVQQRLQGVMAGLLTPFDGNLEIRYDQLQENAASLYDSGIRTFLASANISEYHSLTQQERIAVTESSIDALPSDACVLAGAGGPTDAARELVQAYERAGADGIMVMPPGHSYVHERGLIRYYERLDAATDAPIVPYVKGFDPSVDFLRRLTEVDGVVGVKFALEDPIKLRAGITAGSDDVVWVDGLAEPFAVSFWAEGAEGFSAGVSNFRPEVGLELYEALTVEDWERARRIRDICLPYQDFRTESGQNNTIAGAMSVPAVKKGLELAGMYGGHVREPIRELSSSEEERAEVLYDDLDHKIDRLIG